MDKYTVKMFPQAYRDIDKIYEQALLVSNYADAAIALAEKLEKAILSLKATLNCDFKVFTKEDILPIESQFEISQFVKKTIGVGNVCEPSVRLLGGEIILKKQKLDGVTLCIGEIK